MNWPANDDDLIRQVVIQNEGGYVNDSRDSGGPTNFGITQATLSAWRGRIVSVDDVKNMPMAEAIAIYKKRYTEEPGFEAVADIKLRTALVDASVLFGPQTVIKALQKSLGVPPDGVLGHDTLFALEHLEARGLINALSVWRVMKHSARCAVNPSQIGFLVDWNQRATSFIV
jgi:lysozyme family protein